SLRNREIVSPQFLDGVGMHLSRLRSSRGICVLSSRLSPWRFMCLVGGRSLMSMGNCAVVAMVRRSFNKRRKRRPNGSRCVPCYGMILNLGVPYFLLGESVTCLRQRMIFLARIQFNS